MQTWSAGAVRSSSCPNLLRQNAGRESLYSCTKSDSVHHDPTGNKWETENHTFKRHLDCSVNAIERARAVRHHCGSVYVVDQGEQEMLQRRVLVLTLTGAGECPVHRRGGRKLRRSGVLVGTSRLVADRG